MSGLDAAAECNNKLIGRTGLDVDMRRAADELGFAGRDDQHQLRALQPGEFFAFGPALGGSVERVRIGPVATTHPKAGSRIAFKPPPPTEKVRRLLPRLEDLPKEVEQERKDNETLRRELADVRRRLTLAEKAGQAAGAPQPPPAPSADQIDRAVTRAVAKATKALETAHVRDLRAAAAEQDRLERVVKDVSATLTGAAERLAKALNGSGAGAKVPTPAASRPVTAPVSRPMSRPARYEPEATTAEAMSDEMSLPAADRAVAVGGGNAQAALDALLAMETMGVPECDRATVAAWVGIAPGGSTLRALLSRLNRAGLIEYPGVKLVQLTDAGRSEARYLDAPTTLSDLHHMWLARCTGNQRDALVMLLEAYPEALTREDIADRLDMERGGSTLRAMLSRLKRLGATEHPATGLVRAGPWLFPEGLT